MKKKSFINGAVEFSVTVKQKHSFSKQHLKAAEYFAKRATEIESTTNSKPNEIQSQHRAYVTGAILSAVAALESSINELYLEAQDKNQHTLKGLNGGKISLLGQFWPEIERYSILHKYQTVLLIVGNDKFDKGQSPYQDVASLIKLRNTLVHYKPEWDDNLNINKNLEKRLHRKFSDCVFAPPNSLWFPHKCLGSGCAKWSVNTVNVFMQEFCQRAKVPKRF